MPNIDEMLAAFDNKVDTRQTEFTTHPQPILPKKYEEELENQLELCIQLLRRLYLCNMPLEQQEGFKPPWGMTVAAFIEHVDRDLHNDIVMFLCNRKINK